MRSGSLIKTKKDASVASSTAGNRGNILQMGETSDRPICISRSPCSSHLRIAGSDGQRSAISRCSQPSLELSTRLGVSSSMSGSEGIATHEYGERNLSPRCASLGARILASRSEEESSVTSPHDLEPSRSPQRHSNFAAASERTRYDSRGMEMWGWSRNLTEWSDEQKNLLKSGWRDSTLKTYKSAWGRWCNWIKDNGVDMNCPTGSDLARYLSDLYQKEGLAYKTILLHKSVVSTMCNTESSGSLSNHSLVKQVLKAISLKKPKLTKPPIWDLKQLTTYLSTVQVNKDSLYEVSRHTAALLLLCSGRRVHDLTLLNIDSNHMFSTDDSIVLWPMFGSKTDTTDYRQCGWKLLNNDTCEALNPIYWIKLLIRLSQERRGNVNNLFVTLRGIPKAASRTIIKLVPGSSHC